MKFSIILTFYSGVCFDLDFSNFCHPKGWTVDLVLPFVSIGFGTGICREM